MQFMCFLLNDKVYTLLKKDQVRFSGCSKMFALFVTPRFFLRCSLPGKRGRTTKYVMSYDNNVLTNILLPAAPQKGSFLDRQTFSFSLKFCIFSLVKYDEQNNRPKNDKSSNCWATIKCSVPTIIRLYFAFFRLLSLYSH